MCMCMCVKMESGKIIEVQGDECMGDGMCV